MKNKMNLLILIIIGILVQVSIINNGVLFRIYPNIILVLTSYVAQRQGRIIGGLFGLISGILIDVLLSPNLGIKALSYLIIGYVVGIISEFIFEESYRTAIFYVVIGSVFYSIINNFIYFFLSYNINVYLILIDLFKLETIVNIFLFLVVQELQVEKNRNFKFPKLKKV
ncbi:MAG: rod shape-determining protein MreD [Tissierellia bacterium]|nr:rod shape-determining protein MreD [Tissierellia bacterium]